MYIQKKKYKEIALEINVHWTEEELGDSIVWNFLIIYAQEGADKLTGLTSLQY